MGNRNVLGCRRQQNVPLGPRQTRRLLKGVLLPVAARVMEAARQVGDQHPVAFVVVPGVLDRVRVLGDPPERLGRQRLLHSAQRLLVGRSRIRTPPAIPSA